MIAIIKKVLNLESSIHWLFHSNFQWNPLTLFRMGIFGAAHRWKGQKGPPSVPKICDTYPTTMKIGTVISYLRIIQKIYELQDKPLEFCWHPNIFTRSQQRYINKYRYILHFKYIILNIFFEFLSVVLINVVPT